MSNKVTKWFEAPVKRSESIKTNLLIFMGTAVLAVIFGYFLSINIVFDTRAKVVEEMKATTAALTVSTSKE